MAEKTKAALLKERREKRAERRARQRENNVKRAQKMHKARIEGEATLFPASTPTADPADGNKLTHHVGCSGWFYWEWKGQFYPEGLPSREWFAHYMKNFATVELNAPFYSWPTIAAVQGWKKQTEQGQAAGAAPFLYTVKVCELITHIKGFQETDELIKDFGYIADLLGPHMGCLLYQLPPSFDYSSERLHAIVAQLDPVRRNVVEFRHASWWNPETYKALTMAGVIFCCCSAPNLPSDLIRTADDIYIRFHGLTEWYLHDYSREELKDWADRIRGSQARQAWIYFNNTKQGNAVPNARQLIELLDRQRL